SATSFQLQGGKVTLSLTDGTSALNSSSTLSQSNSISATTTLQFVDNSGTAPAALSGTSITAGATVQDLVDGLNGVAGVRAEFDDNTGELTIYSDEDIYLNDTGATVGAVLTIDGDNAEVDAAAFTATSQLLSNSGSFAVGDTLTLTDGNGYELGSLEVDEETTVDDLENFINDFNGVTGKFDTSSGKLNITSDTDLGLTSSNSDFASSSFVADTDGVTISALSDSGFSTDTKVNRVLDRLNTALSNLRSQASEFGTNLSTVEIRQDYTKTMINTLQEGAGLLTLADTNEEGANLLALQTRQQLASTSLSFASQADQTVLSLF
ncbi:flagellin, partial [Roseibium salinum]